MNDAHRQLLSGNAAAQHQSPLFGKLPGEVRSQIFALALSDYPDPDPDHQYATETCYTRPSYFAPRKTDTELLRTCRAVYTECWHMPFALREQMHWVTDAARAPPGSESLQLRQRLAHIAELQGETEIGSLRIFAQMYMLEEGKVATLLATPFLHPRTVTLTIRHADWWYWETDDPLYFEGSWIEGFCDAMSSSVREVHVELESLERKKQQVDDIAKQMAERWCFKRRDGVVLYADATKGAAQVSRWSGTSTWLEERWVRDETEPGRIDYYVVTVSFRPEIVLERQGGSIGERARKTARRGYSDTSRLKLHLPEATRMSYRNPSIYVGTPEPPVHTS
ncbi:hypothetical protein HRG_006164 [Hirsutella rhossiliensis]|uniref:Uncharacterized protein n=1 Tax=Hirsutella rhossiliensis TaxID=111463 RepID=A0A9P8MYP0_9HYPO|nr:uncharacterized protein HRG_06164 [Hirsutella rhossiliensis]KAH0963654.1 hypothetical protein HRG_06164 [Hirsutella rhossiliensis]